MGWPTYRSERRPNEHKREQRLSEKAGHHNVAAAASAGATVGDKISTARCRVAARPPVACKTRPSTGDKVLLRRHAFIRATPSPIAVLTRQRDVAH